MLEVFQLTGHRSRSLWGPEAQSGHQSRAPRHAGGAELIPAGSRMSHPSWERLGGSDKLGGSDPSLVAVTSAWWQLQQGHSSHGVSPALSCLSLCCWHAFM